MKIMAPQLAQTLQRQFPVICLIAADEPLQFREASDLLRQVALQQGFTERQSYQVESGFDWQQLQMHSNSLSLFATKTVLECHFEAAPDSQAIAFLSNYISAPPTDKTLLLTVPKLEYKQLQTSWLKMIDGAGVVVQTKQLDMLQLPKWLQQRAAQLQLQCATPQALSLAMLVEGNMLAAAQELEKIAMDIGSGGVVTDAIIDTIARSSRHSVFTFFDAALMGDYQRVVAMAKSLQAEGLALLQVLWIWERGVRYLLTLQAAIENRADLAPLWKSMQIWSNQQSLYRKAVVRKTRLQWQQLYSRIVLLHHQVVSGKTVYDEWDELQSIALQLSGVKGV